MAFCACIGPPNDGGGVSRKTQREIYRLRSLNWGQMSWLALCSFDLGVDVLAHSGKNALVSHIFRVRSRPSTSSQVGGSIGNDDPKPYPNSRTTPQRSIIVCTPSNPRSIALNIFIVGFVLIHSLDILVIGIENRACYRLVPRQTRPCWCFVVLSTATGSDHQRASERRSLEVRNL